MTIEACVRRFAERLSGIYICPSLPRGVRADYDLRKWLPRLRVATVFDVGANVGQSARKYHEAFPHAQLYCFEPIESTFRVLSQNTRGVPTIQCYQTALGSRRGTARIYSACPLDSCAYICDGNGVCPSGTGQYETIEIDTIDAFCQNHAVEAISYLKVDTEGYDLDVLMGARGMLDKQLIDAVQVEAGMNAGNTRHVPFCRLAEYLGKLDYYVFALYDQVREWPANQPHLRRVNAVFISKRLIDVHCPRQ